MALAKIPIEDILRWILKLNRFNITELRNACGVEPQSSKHRSPNATRIYNLIEKMVERGELEIVDKSAHRMREYVVRNADKIRKRLSDLAPSHEELQVRSMEGVGTYSGEVERVPNRRLTTVERDEEAAKLSIVLAEHERRIQQTEQLLGVLIKLLERMK